jgi:hypothetical protein
VTLVHIVLGAAAVLVNAAAGVDGLALGRATERFWQLSSAGLACIVLQLITGFFMFGTAGDDIDPFHIALPVVAIGILLLGRSRSTDRDVRAAAAAAVAAAVASAVAFATGLAAT